MARKGLIKAVAYLRTSSAANVGTDKDSEKRQRGAIETFARSAGYEIVETYYDEAVSGADSIDIRPGFRTMLDRLLGNGVRIILVETASRFARDLIVQETGHAMLKARGIEIVAADSPAGFLDDTPTATLIRQILGAVSQFEKTMTRQQASRRPRPQAGDRGQGRGPQKPCRDESRDDQAGAETASLSREWPTSFAARRIGGAGGGWPCQLARKPLFGVCDRANAGWLAAIDRKSATAPHKRLEASRCQQDPLCRPEPKIAPRSPAGAVSGQFRRSLPRQSPATVRSGGRRGRDQKSAQHVSSTRCDRSSKATVGLNKGQLRRGSKTDPRDDRPTLAEAGIGKHLADEGRKLGAE